MLSGNSRGHKLREAQNFLQEVLAEGALPQTEIEAAAERKGIKPKTLRNARYELGVTSRKVGKHKIIKKYRQYFGLEAAFQRNTCMK